MNFDLRLPIGAMFSLFGTILVIFGLANSEASTRLNININLCWGLVMLVFGLVMLVAALTGRKR